MAHDVSDDTFFALQVGILSGGNNVSHRVSNAIIQRIEHVQDKAPDDQHPCERGKQGKMETNSA